MEAENIEETGSSLADDLAAAWDSVEGGDDGGESGISESDVYQSGAEASGEGGDTGFERDNADFETGVSGAQERDLREQGTEQADDKPPVGLSAAAREVWKDVPEAVKQEIAKREKDFAYKIQETSVNAKAGEQLRSTMAPYQQLFAMNNASPPELVGQLLQTASILQMGSPKQKAEMAANLIKTFDIDVRTLDNLLVGQAPPPEVQQQSEVQMAVQQAVAPYQQMMSQMQQQQQWAMQQGQQEIASEVDSFAQQNEFYADVRMEMADILDLAANRGVEMSLQEAYEKACALNPQISKIMEQRAAQASLTGKRRAASSVRGGPGGDGRGGSPESVRSALEDAWDNAGRM